MGAWIETRLNLLLDLEAEVAPRVGAWIETDTIIDEIPIVMSHPEWVRGLKQPTS